MFYRKSFIINLLVTPLIISCSERKSIDLYDESPFWITNNSQIIISNKKASENNSQFKNSPFIMHNYKNSGYTIFSELEPVGVLWREVYLCFYITPLNGIPKGYEASNYSFDTPRRIDKDIDYIPVTNHKFYPSENINDEKEKEKIESIFANDTQINKHTLNEVYLTNCCSYYAYNDDIHLFADENQFSFSTGLIKGTNGENINIILKATSDTSFKIYEFPNKEKVGNVLLEGTMSNVINENREYKIHFKTTNDFFFNGKYSEFTLNADYSKRNYSEAETCDPNFDFIFPEDID